MVCGFLIWTDVAYLSTVAFSRLRSLSITGWIPSIKNSYRRWILNSKLSFEKKKSFNKIIIIILIILNISSAPCLSMMTLLAQKTKNSAIHKTKNMNSKFRCVLNWEQVSASRQIRNWSSARIHQIYILLFIFLVNWWIKLGNSGMNKLFFFWRGRGKDTRTLYATN